MTDIEQTAQQRVAADEAALRRTKKQVTLGGTFRAFWRYPSPWMITAALVLTLAARIVVGDWRLGDLWGPVVLVALFPVLEWVVHVFVLHWRPRDVAGVTLDTLLARKHREHHTDPRDVPLVFIPWQALVWVMVGYNALALLAFPRIGQALSFMLAVAVLGLAYEWTHYLIHSDYKPQDPGLQGGLAQPPAAPLQERALLVHGHLDVDRRPAVRDVPRPRHRGDLAHGEEPPRRVVGRTGKQTRRHLCCHPT